MFDNDAINRAISEAFNATADAYAEAQIEAMNAPIYDWDGTTTVRKSGEVVTSPRDIPDTRHLENSLVQLKGIGLRTYIYLAAYALDVHEGYVTESGTVKPDRKWTKVAREIFINLELTMADELRNRF